MSVTSSARYRRLAQLGKGHSGTVYLVRAALSGTLVVLKVAHHQHDGTLANEQAILTFMQQQGPIQGIPRLLDTLTFETAQGWQMALIMEYVKGERVSDLTAHSFPLATVIRLITDFFQIMARVHGRGIVHHDLFDKNVLLGDDGHLSVIDFGHAYRVQDQIEQSEEVRDMLILAEDWLDRLPLRSEWHDGRAMRHWLTERRRELDEVQFIAHNAAFFFHRWHTFLHHHLPASHVSAV